jgi:hypothetical protein
MQIQ